MYLKGVCCIAQKTKKPETAQFTGVWILLFLSSVEADQISQA
jgi:hypothetical protein